MNAEAALRDVPLGGHTTALLGVDDGKYPDANGLLVVGDERTVLIEPTLGVRRRIEAGDLAGHRPEEIDAVLLSHVHEDHVPALPLLPDADCWVHEDDRGGLDDLDAFLDLYGLPEPARAEFRELCIERFHYAPRPRARDFADGHRWDLGGVVVQALHTPGHTPGHCFFVVQPDEVVYLGDFDLSTFGPYYGDVGGSVDDFLRTCERASTLDARWYVTGHHKAIVEGRERFLEMCSRYASVIAQREERLLEMLAEPLDIDEIASRRLIYRSHDEGLFVDTVERRAATLHLERLERSGLVQRLSGDRKRFVASTV